MHVYRAAFTKAFGKVVAFQQPGHRIVTAEAHHLGRRQGIGPFGVEANLCARRIENFEDLLGVGLGVAPDVVARERLAGL